MARIHHATLAKAKKFNVTLTLEDGDVVATDKSGKRLASGLQGNKVLEEALTKMTGHPDKKSVAQKNTIIDPKNPPKSFVRKVVKRAKELELEDDEETGEESEALATESDEDSDADLRRSGVKHKYKELYKPHGGKCGDDLSLRVSEHVTGDDGKVSKTALRRFAEANGAWKPLYGTLTTKSGAWNAGMARMNVSNILRAKLRRAQNGGDKFEIQWV